MNYTGFEIAAFAVSGTYSDCSCTLDCSCSHNPSNLCYRQYTLHIVGIVSVLVRVSLVGVPLIWIALVVVAVVGSIIGLVVVITEAIIIVGVILLIVVVALIVALIIVVLAISLSILLPT